MHLSYVVDALLGAVAVYLVNMILCVVNILRPRQNGRHFADGIFKCIFLNENVWISLKISLESVAKVRISNILSLVQIMVWRRPGDKPLSEPKMVILLRHICHNCWWRRLLCYCPHHIVYSTLYNGRIFHFCNTANYLYNCCLTLICRCSEYDVTILEFHGVYWKRKHTPCLFVLQYNLLPFE